MYEENILMNIDDSSIKDVGDIGHYDCDELEMILKEIDDSSSDYNFNTETLLTVKLIDYDTNYSVKQLLLICDYYGLLWGEKYTESLPF